MRQGKLKRSEAWFGFLLVMPLFAWLIITIGYPFLISVRMSFLDVQFIGERGSFVGLSNYLKILSDASFWYSAIRSLIWVLGNMVIQTLLGFFAALLLNEKIRGINFMRNWVVLPWILPTVVVAIMWRWILNATLGVANYVLTTLNVVSNPINFLGDPSKAMYTLIFINSWRWFPFITVLLLAALQSIPDEQYEAASIDGANKWQAFTMITVPNLRPTMTVLGVLGPLLTFNIFDIIWMLTQGGPSRVTQTVPVLMYERGFRAFLMSEATTISTIMSIFLVIYILVYVKVTKINLSE